MKINQEIAEDIFSNINVKPIKIEFLAKGTNNENYKIYSDKKDFILRIELGHQFNNLEKEYNFLKKFRGLGPKVFYLDSSKKVIPATFFIEEFIEGKHIDKIEGTFLKAAGKWYRKLHSSKNSNHSKYSTKDMFFDIEILFNNSVLTRYNKFSSTLSKEWEEKLSLYLKHVLEVVKKNKNLFSELGELSLIHGDPSKGNIFYSGEKIKVIDWEFAKYSIFESELAFFIWTHELNKKQKQLFLESYKYDFSKKSLKKLDVAYLIHLLSMISWRVQRLDLISKGKIENGEYLSTKEDIYKITEKDLQYVGKLIKSLS